MDFTKDAMQWDYNPPIKWHVVSTDLKGLENFNITQCTCGKITNGADACSDKCAEFQLPM